MLFISIGFRVRKKLDKNVYTRSSRPLHRIIFHSGKALLSKYRKLSARLLVRDVATKESWSRDASILPKHSTYIYIVEQATKNSKNTLEKGYKFLFENDCHDDYCRLIWTINSCRGECFKSLRKNERPHNVNSCDKCYCTAGGNGYCNQMFLLHKCLNSLNSQELEWRQSSVL